MEASYILDACYCFTEQLQILYVYAAKDMLDTVSHPNKDMLEMSINVSVKLSADALQPTTLHARKS